MVGASAMQQQSRRNVEPWTCVFGRPMGDRQQTHAFMALHWHVSDRQTLASRMFCKAVTPSNRIPADPTHRQHFRFGHSSRRMVFITHKCCITGLSRPADVGAVCSAGGGGSGDRLGQCGPYGTSAAPDGLLMVSEAYSVLHMACHSLLACTRVSRSPQLSPRQLPAVAAVMDAHRHLPTSFAFTPALFFLLLLLVCRRPESAACVLAAAALALVCLGWLPLCSAQTAYIMPFLAEDSPSNHSYRRLGSIITNRGLLQDYDEILLLTDYRVTPSLLGQSEPVRLSRNLTIASANFTTQGYRLLEVCRTRWPQRSCGERLSTAARSRSVP